MPKNMFSKKYIQEIFVPESMLIKKVLEIHQEIYAREMSNNFLPQKFRNVTFREICSKYFVRNTRPR